MHIDDIVTHALVCVDRAQTAEKSYSPVQTVQVIDLKTLSILDNRSLCKSYNYLKRNTK